VRDLNYILRGTETIPASMEEWAQWYEQSHKAKDNYRTIGRTFFPLEDGRYFWVSTVFLGLDHQYGDGPPILFETMVFGDSDMTDHYQQRYSTWHEAMDGHHALCLQIAENLNQRGLENADLRRLSPGLPGE
jgi:hypothetical protein